MSFFRGLRKMASVDISSLRLKYKSGHEVFLEQDLKVKEPFAIFREWFNEALSSPEIPEPNGACIATVDSDGRPSNRFVLLKDFTDQGFTFFTNYSSRKAKDIASNPNVAMTLYWVPLRKSIRIEGVAEKIPKEESEAYFRSRPRESQIGALVSNQSQKIPGRNHLEQIRQEIISKIGESGPVPMPDWGGYLVKPHSIEFWQGQSDRIHDRIRFRKGGGVEQEIDGNLTFRGENGWVYERLAP